MHTDEGFDFDKAKELGFNIVEIEGGNILDIELKTSNEENFDNFYRNINNVLSKLEEGN